MRTRIIFMLAVMAVVATLAQADQTAWVWDSETLNPGGWNVIWNSPMSWDVWDDYAVSGGVGAWWFEPQDTDATILPGGVNGCETMKYSVRPSVAPSHGSGNRYEYAPTLDATKWGTTFVSPSWSGKAADVATIAAYISPGFLFGEQGWGGQGYNYPWEKPYYKVQTRLAVTGAAADTFVRVRTYAYASALGDWGWETADALTLISYTDIPVGALADQEWLNAYLLLAKPDGYTHNMPGVLGSDRTWFELEILNGTANTKLYIDEFSAISDQSWDTAVYGTAPDWVLSIPEPATMLILALGGLMLRRNRK